MRVVKRPAGGVEQVISGGMGNWKFFREQISTCLLATAPGTPKYRHGCFHSTSIHLDREVWAARSIPNQVATILMYAWLLAQLLQVSYQNL